MSEILKEFQALRVKKGETVFIRPQRAMAADELEEFKRAFDGACLDCMVVVLPYDVEVAAIAE